MITPLSRDCSRSGHSHKENESSSGMHVLQKLAYDQRHMQLQQKTAMETLQKSNWEMGRFISYV